MVGDGRRLTDAVVGLRSARENITLIHRGLSIDPQKSPYAEESEQRAKLYVRVVAAVGIVLTLLFLWQVLTKL